MTPEDWENLVKRGKTAVQGAALKLATDAIETLEEWQKPRESRFRGNLLTEDESEAMLEAQGGVCAICKEKPKGVAFRWITFTGRTRFEGFSATFAIPRWDCSKITRTG